MHRRSSRRAFLILLIVVLIAGCVQGIKPSAVLVCQIFEVTLSVPVMQITCMTGSGL